MKRTWAPNGLGHQRHCLRVLKQLLLHCDSQHRGSDMLICMHFSPFLRHEHS